jgi:hypothetical protein
MAYGFFLSTARFHFLNIANDLAKLEEVAFLAVLSVSSQSSVKFKNR